MTTTAVRRPTRKKAPVKKVGSTVVAFVLDCSTSMLKVRQETLAGLNAQIAAVKAGAKKAGKTRFGLTKFSTTVTVPESFVSTDKLKPLTSSEYQPDGWTSLYDAIALTTERLLEQHAQDPDTAFLVITLTDGDENSSVRYAARNAGAQRLAERIQTLQLTGRWTFTFIGANIDVEEMSRRLAIPQQNVTWYTPDSVGTSRAFNLTASATEQFLGERGRGVVQTRGFYANTGTGETNK